VRRSASAGTVWLRGGAAAGIVAPILFTMLVIVQSVLQPEYSHVAVPISALAARPHGWIQNLNFFAFSVLMTAYAIGLHVGLRPTRGGLVGPGLVARRDVRMLKTDERPTSKDGHAISSST